MLWGSHRKQFAVYVCADLGCRDHIAEGHANQIEVGIRNFIGMQEK